MTFEGPHVTTSMLEGMRHLPMLPRPLSQLRPALHLARNCPKCWSAATQLNPFDYAESETTSPDPVIACLRRIGGRFCWPILSSDHRAALARVRERPLGFAHAVAEEARCMSGMTLYGQEPAERGTHPGAFGQAFLLADLLDQETPGDAAVAELFARLYSQLGLYFSSQFNDLEAHKACSNALHFADAASCADRTALVNIHEVEIRLATDPDKAVESTSAAHNMVTEDPSWRRVELDLQLHVTLKRLECDPSQSAWVLRRAFAELDTIKRSGAGLERLHAVHTGTLVMCRLARHLSEEERVARYEAALLELEEAKSLYETYGDALARRMRTSLAAFVELSLAELKEPTGEIFLEAC